MNAVVVIRLPKEIKDKIGIIAQRKGLTVSTLVRMWIIEKLRSTR